MYTCIAGVHPQPASEREKEEQMVPIKELAPATYSSELLEIIEWCLRLDHLARPQTAFELQKALMKDVAELREPEENLELIEDSFSGRLKKTLNRKIF